MPLNKSAMPISSLIALRRRQSTMADHCISPQTVATGMMLGFVTGWLMGLLVAGLRSR